MLCPSLRLGVQIKLCANLPIHDNGDASPLATQLGFTLAMWTPPPPDAVYHAENTEVHAPASRATNQGVL